MPRLIDTSGTLLDDPWLLLPRTADLAAVLAAPATDVLVNVELWLTQRDKLAAAGKKSAPWLDSDQPAALLDGKLTGVQLVALNFPKFTDGRSYSTAVRLRRLGYAGELRAIGDVLRDQLYYMKRCGFTTFDLQDGVRLEDARKAFRDFTTNYQATIEEPLPLFRRRA
jgi:uncharacterized protein (DUF934 family)